MRDTNPDGNPEPVAERQWGQDVLNEELKSDRLNPDKQLLGTEIGIADAMRFTGELGRALVTCSVCFLTASAPVLLMSAYINLMYGLSSRIKHHAPMLRPGMLHAGAIPEVANCRLAMLAVVAAIAAEGMHPLVALHGAFGMNSHLQADHASFWSPHSLSPF